MGRKACQARGGGMGKLRRKFRANRSPILALWGVSSRPTTPPHWVRGVMATQSFGSPVRVEEREHSTQQTSFVLPPTPTQARVMAFVVTPGPTGLGTWIARYQNALVQPCFYRSGRRRGPGRCDEMCRIRNERRAALGRNRRDSILPSTRSPSCFAA